MQDPASAANELERAVRTLRFKGALVDGYSSIGTLETGEPQYLPFWQRLVVGFAVLFGLSIASLSLIPASVAVFRALYTIAGFFGGGHAPIPYAKAVSGWFDEKRGLALGITMTGTCTGGALLPLRMARRIHRPRRPDADQPGERAALRFSADDIRRIFGAVFDNS
jgi:hypothetical protein